MAQRPISTVPAGVHALLLVALLAQLVMIPPPVPPRAQPLAPAPSAAVLRLASLGEPIALSKGLMLYLQSHDDQAGAPQSLNQLDYAVLRDWLGRALDLDPRAQYPLLAASQVYGAAADPARTRLMLDFVYQRFAEDPNRRWPWLAHAALVARHRLHDLPLARRYAQAVRTQATGAQVPAFARQLEAFILEDMNELESAKALFKGMLASGQVSDPRELAFLEQRLHSISARQRQGAPCCAKLLPPM